MHHGLSGASELTWIGFIHGLDWIGSDDRYLGYKITSF